MDRVHDKRPSFERPLLSPYLVTHTLLIMSTPLIVDECIQHPYDQIYFQWLCILKHYFMICSLLCGWEDCGNCAQHCRQPIHDEHFSEQLAYRRQLMHTHTHTWGLSMLSLSNLCIHCHRDSKASGDICQFFRGAPWSVEGFYSPLLSVSFTL